MLRLREKTNSGIIKSSANVGKTHARKSGRGSLRERMPSDQPPPGRHICGINNTRTHSGGRGGAGGGLTVLEGAAMVSISSWVTHTLPDGYRAGGQGPRGRVAGVW